LVAFLWPSIAVTNYANSVQVTPVTARVLEVGNVKTTQYQCGSTKVGDVDIPRFCTREEWPTTFVIEGADYKFTQTISTHYSVGNQIQAYKVVDNGNYSYSFSDPSSTVFVIFMWFVFALGGAIAGGLSYAFTIGLRD